MKLIQENIVIGAILLAQLAFAFLTTFSLFMIEAILNYNGGFENFVAIAIFHPVIGIILSSLSLVICLIAGLPIRLIKSINKFWKEHFAISILGLFIGIIIMSLAYLPYFREMAKTEEGFPTEIPNNTLSIIGFLITTFFALHTYPPKFIIAILDRLVFKLLPRES
jgi:hypothetical protein